jgi:hypothetical protein
MGWLAKSTEHRGRDEKRARGRHRVPHTGTGHRHSQHTSKLDPSFTLFSFRDLLIQLCRPISELPTCYISTLHTKSLPTWSLAAYILLPSISCTFTAQFISLSSAQGTMSQPPEGYPPKGTVLSTLADWVSFTTGCALFFCDTGIICEDRSYAVLMIGVWCVQDILLRVTLSRRTLHKATTSKAHQLWDRHQFINRDRPSVEAGFSKDGEIFFPSVLKFSGFCAVWWFITLLVKLLSSWLLFRNIFNVFLSSLQEKDEYFVFLLIERVACTLQSGCALLLLPSGRMLLRPRNLPQLLGFF